MKSGILNSILFKLLTGLLAANENTYLVLMTYHAQVFVVCRFNKISLTTNRLVKLRRWCWILLLRHCNLASVTKMFFICVFLPYGVRGEWIRHSMINCQCCKFRTLVFKKCWSFQYVLQWHKKRSIPFFSFFFQNYFGHHSYKATSIVLKCWQ